MEAALLRRYVLEIQHQSSAFSIAIELLNADVAALKHYTNADDVPEWRRSFTSAWIHIQSILTAAAALSRFFWPPKGVKKATPRHEALREIFGLGDDSILADRDVRNSFEHFDERIDHHLTGADAAFRTSHIIDSRERWHRDGIILVRAYDPVRRELYILGKLIDVARLAEEVERLAAAAVRVRQTT